MLKNKNTVIVFVSVVVILVLGISVAFQSAAIKEVKTANNEAQDKIDVLYGHIDTLNSALDDTSNDVEKYKQELEKNKTEVEKNKQELKKYQEILNAWNDASPKVRAEVEKVTDAYGELVENSHLYPENVLDGAYEKMMDTVYAIIRSTTPQKLADDFVKELNSLNPTRFDVIMQGKIDSVKADGLLFPEDVAGYENALAYYNSFAGNPAVLHTFAEKGFDKELADIFAMLDADEEKDLAKNFVDEVTAIDLPITATTSLKNAMLAWDTLQNALEPDDALDDKTLEARALLDSYIARVEELACPPHNCADCIRAKLCDLLSKADEVTRKFLEDIAREVEAWLDCFNLVEATRCLEKAISDLCPCPHATN
ncbi:MAG: hypothetical protein J6S23_03175 [Clostridia bacterium]|nr:hypothetical protein [Clostridia bacterium]